MKVFNHPFNKENCKRRLLEEYYKYGKLTVAFDFDNTIYDYHKNGGDYSEVIQLLQDCSKLGFELILFTSKKPYYNILLDDRAGLEESYEILKYVVDEIKLNQQGNQ